MSQWLVLWPVRDSRRAWVLLLRQYYRLVVDPMGTLQINNVCLGCGNWYWYGVPVKLCGIHSNRDDRAQPRSHL